MQVVWFKRDLRLEDHEPLTRAAKKGPCLCLYVYEPELMASTEFDASHLQFINESLRELDRNLCAKGSRLTYRFGSVVDALDQLHRDHGIEALWSHQETGNGLTFERDKRVASWVKERGIPWHEIPQNGVVRGLRSRDGWSKRRDAFLRQPLVRPPEHVEPDADVNPGKIWDGHELGLDSTVRTGLQSGGERSAGETLQSFLLHRGENYSKEMSSPVTAPTSCSRLSPYLAWGCISMRCVVAALRERQEELRQRKSSGEPVGSWLKSLRAFESRLSWHCHFMQKLEDQPSIEFENMSRVYDGLREDAFNQGFFDAWCAGQTGYPMVDACMRALHQHSWINFRMRAMLVSFASYHLWLHWRPTATFLAQHFLDFEPGIHFSQFQMQSGTTGINTIRIYSPIKQVKDQDPSGTFIRRFVPELDRVPEQYLAEPHKMPLSTQSKVGCVVGKDYPRPIVDHTVAYRAAREKMYAVRRTDEAKQEASRVLRKHGSRKKGTKGARS